MKSMSKNWTGPLFDFALHFSELLGRSIPLVGSMLVYVHAWCQDRRYTSGDMNVVCHWYGSLLIAMAKQTSRVSGGIVEAASKKCFQDTAKAHKDFGVAIAGALSHCYHIARRAKSGEKMAPEVKSVVMSFTSASLRPIQDLLGDRSSETGMDIVAIADAGGSSGSCGDSMGAGRSAPSSCRPHGKQASDVTSAGPASPQPGAEDEILKLYGLPPKRAKVLQRLPSCVSVSSGDGGQHEQETSYTV